MKNLLVLTPTFVRACFINFAPFVFALCMLLTFTLVFTGAGLFAQWQADVRLTNNPATSNTSYNNAWCIASSGSVVHVVWWDNREGNEEIYYKRSTDEGVSWGTDTRLTNNSSRSEYPSVAVSGQVVHVVWQDNRDGNWEIYYKRNPTGNPVGIKNISSEIPSEYKLEQNYPNPFNPNTKIQFALPENTFAKLTTYDILGREVETLVSQQLTPGTYEVVWNASNFTSGVYYYKLQTEIFNDTKKMILLK